MHQRHRQSAAPPQTDTIHQAIRNRSARKHPQSSGDGWNGGYWTITSATGEVVAGGPDAGQVEGAGGEDVFCVSRRGPTAGACDGYVDPREATIVVEITASGYADEITWDVDGGYAPPPPSGILRNL